MNDEVTSFDQKLGQCRMKRLVEVNWRRWNRVVGALKEAVDQVKPARKFPGFRQFDRSG